MCANVLGTTCIGECHPFLQRPDSKSDVVTLVVHGVSGLAPESGGPSRTITALTDGLAKNNLSIVLLTQSQTGKSVFKKGIDSTVDRRIAFSRFSPLLNSGLPFRKLLKNVISEHRPSLIHHHGIWHPASHCSAKLAQQFKIPLLLHTRGMLEPWALDYRAFKKQLAMWLYQRSDLEAVRLFFATAHAEMESLRRFGLKQPIAIIPNGVDLPAFTQKETRDEKTTQRGSPRNAVFMSRIHPIKGILNLVEAWANIRPKKWRLLVAGPDEGAHLAVVMRRVRELGIKDSVEFLGEVDGEIKSELLQSADLFILPSFSENFGVVVAEALAYGVPVIATRGAPWEGLLHHGCGWWIEPTVDTLTKTLQEALNQDLTTLHAMGNRGRTYASEFDWSHIASQTADVYRWILGQEVMPSCVVLD